MSFFGFDTSLPRDRGHQTNAPGFGQHDAFAGLSGGAADDDAYGAHCFLLDTITDHRPASTSRRRTMALATVSTMPTMPSTTTPLAAVLLPSSLWAKTLTLQARPPRSPIRCRRSRCCTRLAKASRNTSRQFLRPPSPTGLVMKATRTQSTSPNWRRAPTSGASSPSNLLSRGSHRHSLLPRPHSKPQRGS